VPPAARACSPGYDGSVTLEDSYERCRQLTRAHGKLYYAATYLLPRVKRHHVHALYGFCRHADDVVEALGAAAPVEDRTRALTELEERFFTDLERGDSDDPVLKAVVHTVVAFDINPDAFRRYLRSMRSSTSLWSIRAARTQRADAGGSMPIPASALAK